MGKETIEVIFENENYIVCTGLSLAENGIRVYKVVNKAHDIVEVETTILPRAISLAKDYNDYMGRINADQVEDDEDMLQFEIPPEDMEVFVDEPPPSVG